MKKKLFFVLAALALAVSCQDNGLDDGQVPQNQIELTATIASPAASRVTYDVNNTAGYEAVTPSWTLGDGLFGFDDSGNAFNLQVEEIDEGGRAKMTVTDGTLAGPTLYVFYAPGMDKDDLSDADGNGLRTLEVDLSSQDGTLSDASPVLMSAKASVLNGGALLVFENNTAIVGVKRFKMPEAATVTGVTLHGVVTSGTFSVDGDGDIVLTPGSVSAVAATADDDEWTTGEGNICSTQVSFAVLPTDDALLTLNAVTATKEYANVAVISSVKIVAGYYYHMAKEFNLPVAQIGSVKYGSIDVAMTIANASDEDVTVTLLDDCTAAGRLNLTNTAGSGDVTLDLNGHTLTAPSTAHCLYVLGRTLTIQDSDEGGSIESDATSSYPLYIGTDANVTLNGGTVTNSVYRAIRIDNNGNFTMNGGSVSAEGYGIALAGSGNISVTGGSISGSRAISSISLTGGTTFTGTLSVSGGSLEAASSYGIYTSDGTINVSGGASVSSNGSGSNTNTVATAGTVSITGGTFTSASTSSATILVSGSGATGTISGGRFNSSALSTVTASNDGVVYVTGGLHSRAVQVKFAVDDDENEYVNLLNTDNDTKATYPFAVGAASENAAVDSVAQGTNYWKHATVEGAFINANQRAAVAAGTGTTIIQLDDATASATLNVNSDNVNGFTLDLNGHTVSATGVSPLIAAASDFTLMDSDGAGELNTTGNVALSVTAGTTTVNSGSLVGAVNAATVAADATLNVNNGYLYGAEDGDDVSADEDASVTLAAGWYRNEPSSDYLSGTVAQSGSETHNNRTYGWTIGVETAVVTVNDEEFASLGAAIAAANAFDGEAEADSVVTIKLLDNIGYDEQISLTNVNDKPIVLDLNNYTLSTDSTGKASFITTTGSLTIMDSSVGGGGQILSKEKNVLYLNSSSALVIVEKCLIKSTFKATSTAGGSASTNSIVYVNNGATLSVENNARIWATDAHVCYAGATGTVTINVENAELTSSNYCIYVGGAATVNITGEETSFYSTGGNLLMYCASASADIAIRDGYFYRNNTGSTPFSSTNIGQYSFTGGHFSAVPTNATAASGYRFDEDEASYTHTTTGTKLSYGYGVLYGLADVADVNGTKYTSFADALAAANIYDGEDATVTLTLLRDVSVDHATFSHASKNMTLDINGHTLSGTDSAAVRYTVSKTFNIVDNGAVKGKITSTKENVVAKAGSTAATINITGCTITSSATGEDYYHDAVVYLFNAKATMNITNCVIYSTGSLTGTTIIAGTAAITGSEISSGTSSTGLVGVCAYNSTASVTINSGCFYTSNTTSTRPAAYAASGTFTINGGFFYGGATSIRTSSSGNFESKFTVKGGYFNNEPSFSGHTPTYENCSLESASETYTHSVKGSLSFTYQAAPTEGAAEAAASLSEAVASYGAPVSGGVKFLRK